MTIGLLARKRDRRQLYQYRRDRPTSDVRANENERQQKPLRAGERRSEESSRSKFDFTGFLSVI
jgi:hypothetical protein